MCRKLFLLALVLGLASSASAGPTWAGTVSSSWNVGGNWIGGAVPGTADTPFIGWLPTDLPAFTPVIGPGMTAVAGGKLNVGGTDKEGILTMTGGTLDVGDSGLYVGNSSRSPYAIVNMSGGAFTVSGADFRIGRRSAAEFNMTGGTLDVVKFKPGARTNDTAYTLSATVVDLATGLVNADYSGIERSKVIVRDAVMVFDSTAGQQVASDIDADIDTAIANNWLRPHGLLNGTTIGSVTYSIVKSWDAFNTILTVTAIPEPATIALLGLGGLALLRRKR
jgi:hypothetical protein